MSRFACSYLLLLIPLALLFQGCEAVPKEALKMKPDTLQQRQLESRVFNSSDEDRILSACGTLLQDMGFNLDQSQSELGLVVASEERDARRTDQVLAATALGLVFGAAADARYDYRQKTRASVVTSPAEGVRGKTAVRIIFQRIVWDQTNRISRVEYIADPKAYQEFFQKLSKALLLEAHNI